MAPDGARAGAPGSAGPTGPSGPITPPVAAHAIETGIQVALPAGQILSFSTPIFDTADILSTQRATVPVAGVYFVGVSSSWELGADSRTLTLRRNGVDSLATTSRMDPGELHLSTVGYLDAGEHLDVVASTPRVNGIAVSWARLSVALVGAVPE